MLKQYATPRRLTVTKRAEWVGRVLFSRIETSTGEKLPRWLERAIADNAPEGVIDVEIYPTAARLRNRLGWVHDVWKPGRPGK